MRKNVMVKLLSAALAGAFLAACSGGGNPGTAFAPGFAPAAAKHTERKGKIVLRIKVPKKRVHRGRHVHFVSPATQSMKVDITNATTNPPTNIAEIVNLTPTSTGCTSTLTSTQCVLTVTLAPASNYNAEITTYDQTGANGNALSTGQDLAFTVSTGQANAINMTLSGIPTSIVVLPYSGTANTNVYGGIDLIGTAASKLLVEALDADGNIILGAGSPTIGATQKSGSLPLVVVTPAPNAANPNLISVTPPSAYSSSTATIEVTASYTGQPVDGCAQTGAVCYADVPVDMQQLMAVASGSKFTVFELGTQTALATVAPDGQINDVAFDSSGNLYVSECATCSESGSDAILRYAPPYTGSPVSITSGIDHPEGIAFDKNGVLYVANDVVLAGGSQDTIAVYDPPFNASSAPAKTYTNTVNQPEALAIDAAGDLFVSELTGNGGNGQVVGFSSGYSSGPPTYGAITSGITLTNSGVGSIALDASDNLYVASPTLNHITKYFGPLTTSSTAYTCSTCTLISGGTSSNPKTVTACGGCTGFTPTLIAALSSTGNAPDGYGFMVADQANNAVRQYTNATVPAFSRSITTNVVIPTGLLLDSSSNLYVANTGSAEVTQYDASGGYAYTQTVLSSFSAPTMMALLP